MEFFILQSFQPHYDLAIDSVYNRNEYQEYFLVGGKGVRCLGLTTIPYTCADSLEIWEPQPPGTHRVCPELSWRCFTFALLLPPTLVFLYFLTVFYVALQRARSSQTDDEGGKVRRWGVQGELRQFTVKGDRPTLKTT
jgi:hypothetical protein